MQGFGLVVGHRIVVLWRFPAPHFVGMLARILRFVTYIGARHRAIFPLILAAAVGSERTMVLEDRRPFLILGTATRASHRTVPVWPQLGAFAGGGHRLGHCWTWLWRDGSE